MYACTLIIVGVLGILQIMKIGIIVIILLCLGMVALAITTSRLLTYQKKEEEEKEKQEPEYIASVRIVPIHSEKLTAITGSRHPTISDPWRQGLVYQHLIHGHLSKLVPELRFHSCIYYRDGNAFIIHVDPLLLKPGQVNEITKSSVLKELSRILKARVISPEYDIAYIIIIESDDRDTLPRRVDLGEIPVGGYMVPLGEGGSGPEWVSMFELLNVLIGGAPGSGKSMLLNAWLTALTTAHTPDELTLTLIDPKRVEMSSWGHLPHLIHNIVTTPEEAESATNQLLLEIDHRATLLQSKGCRNLSTYNHVANEPLSLHLIIIDELTDLAFAAGGARSDLFKNLVRIGSVGRALGIFLVLATQSPRSEIINSNLKAILNTRISFRVPTAVDSRVILDTTHASEIPANIPGRMVIIRDGEPIFFQAPYLPDERTTWQPTLSDDIMRLVHVADEHLNGEFNVGKLYSIVGPARDGGISKRQIEKYARQLDNMGLLSSYTDSVNGRGSRQVTTRLRELTD